MRLKNEGMDERLLSNQGIEVWKFFGYWVPYMVGARTEVVVALDWTSFARDGHETIVISMLTGDGRATPLLWKTVEASKLKGSVQIRMITRPTQHRKRRRRKGHGMLFPLLHSVSGDGPLGPFEIDFRPQSAPSFRWCAYLRERSRWRPGATGPIR